MAVYEHTYKPYEGALTAAWSRFLVIPRYAYQDLFKYKTFIALFVACYVCPVIYLVLIYFRHNTQALTGLGRPATQLAGALSINEFFFYIFIYIQTILGFIFTVIIGPILISRDLTNNALPLYLSRPFTRFEYLIGKISVLVILLSAITWVPGLLLFIFQCFLGGSEWVSEYLWVAWAIICSSFVWIAVLTLIAMALSALLKWRLAASGAMFAVFIIPLAIGGTIQGVFDTTYGHIISPLVTLPVVTGELFRQDMSGIFPTWVAWCAIIGYIAICLLILTRKVRAYEVVS